VGLIFWAVMAGAVPSLMAQTEGAASPPENAGSETAPAEGAPAESSPEPAESPRMESAKRVSPEQVEAEIAKLPNQGSDAPPSRAREALSKALSELSSEERWRNDLADYQKGADVSAEKLAADLDAAQNEAAQFDARSLPDSLEEVEAAFKLSALDLKKVADRAKELADLLNTAPQKRVKQSERRNELSRLIGELEQQNLGTDPDSLLKRAQLQAYDAEMDFLDYALSTADARKTIRTKRLEIARVREAALSKWNERLATKASNLREDALRQQELAMERAAREADRDQPLLKKLAERNATLLERRRELRELLAGTTQIRTDYEERAAIINKRLDEIQRRVEISGFSQAAAAIMLKELRRLPSERQLRSEQRWLEGQVRDTQLELFDLSGHLKPGLGMLEAYESTGIPIEPEDEGWLIQNEDNETLEDLLGQHQDITEGLREDANRYFEALLATDSEIMAAAQAADRFRDYASENILWIPSRSTLSTQDLSAVPSLVRDALGEFTGLFDSIVRGPVLRAMVFIFVVGVLLFIAIKLSRHMGKERLRAADWADYGRTVRFALYELFIAVLPLGSLYLLAWTVNDPKLDGNLADAIEYTATRSAWAIFTLVLLYRITRPNSMAQLELRWPPNVCERINKAVRLFLFPAVGFAIVAMTLDQFGQVAGQPAGARFFLLPAFGCCLLAFHILFSPQHGILAEGKLRFWRENNTARWLIYLFIMGWQSFLAALVFGGYMLGALMLWGHTFRTFWIIAGVMVIKGLVQRYLEIQHWRAKMQQLEEEAAGNETTESERLSFSMDDSTRQVVGFLQWVALILGISAVWADAFPSLRKIGTEPMLQFGGGGEITWGQGAMLLVCIVTTALLARSLPRLVEILILRRISSIAPGTRHAFATLVTYVVVIFGVIWASNILLIEWGKIQWLVAAISVGLGFGLQEIFGNLVAGIILLFERPIRVGDIVTVGGTTGMVTRIQMRGTTIREWDRRELIVPNKEFVTGQLTNWTLSDTLTRLTLNVGVAYGSDISKVKELLMEAIKKDRRVLKDPAPAVFFQQFGESSLDFLCFAYLGTLDERLGAASDLQQNIYEAFNQANITIPFPQRDLHIIDSSAIQVHGLRGGSGSRAVNE